MKKILSKVSVITLVASLGFGLFGTAPAVAATTPSLGTAGTYGVLSSTFTRNVGVTAITGDLGYTTLGGSGSHTVTGLTNIGGGAGDAAYQQAGTDQATALTALAAQTCTFTFADGAIDLATDTTHGPIGVYTPGVYCTGASSAAEIGTAGITLDGAGTYIFRTNGALTSVANSVVTLANGASACDVFWTATSATTLGANTTFKGTIIDDSGITVGDTTAWVGRALAFGGTVTTDTDTISVPTGCTVAATPSSSDGDKPIPPEPPLLTVFKHVINDNGGTAIASDFSIAVKYAGQNVAGSPADGREDGRIYQLANTGTTTVSELPMAGYSATFSGDCNSNGEVHMEFGDKKTCTITNNDIALVPPLINVTKIPTPLALPDGAGSVKYDYVVTNLGVVGMFNVKVTDDKCANVSYVSGDLNGNSRLGIDETWRYTCTTTLSETTTNIVTATGQANGFTAIDVATANVVVGVPVVPPLIHLVKKPSVFFLSSSGPVTYTYTVTNPGTAPLSNVNITDDKCTGLPGRVVGHPGDLNKNNLLESNEVWSFTCQTNLTQTTTNTGTAYGSANGLTAIDLSFATVVVTPPKLPDTGVAPDEKNTPWAIAIPTGILAVLTLFYIARKKQTA